MALSTTITLKFAGAAVQRGLASIKKGFQALNKSGGAMLGGLASKALKLASILGPIATFAGIGKLGVDAVQAASSMETLQTQFGALLKSQDKATALIDKLRQMNIESPLGLTDFAAGAKQLLGVRMSADEAADSLDKLSNISMRNAANFDSLVRAFSQTRSAGRLMGQEVLQYVNAGFNPLNEISVMTGESMATLKKRMEDGKISFSEVAAAISHATAQGGLFNGMNKKIAETTEGRIQKLKDSWNQILIAFGTPLTDHLKPMIDGLSASMAGMIDTVKQWGESTGRLGTAIVNAFKNEQLWDLIKSGLTAAFKMAGAQLLAIATLAGEMFASAATGKLGKGTAKFFEDASILNKKISGNLIPDSMRFSESDFFKTKYEPGEFQKTREAAYQMVGFDQSREAFTQKIKQNQFQNGMVPGTNGKYRYAQEGERSIFSDQMGNKVIEVLQTIDRRLQPQP